eukprot:TRINITY_DN2370_c0_g1_i1.p1 TRINITY_DN2370_c0_g1~~TRINITY_DN2370_c0_g1_i1.p1  ORF type:complete len:246 (+),score=55.80 TRINITY_DN2370_c0_g1_i1:3-740(+)
MEQSSSKRRRVEEAEMAENTIEKLFEGFSKAIEDEIEGKDKIKSHLKAIDISIRHATVHAQQIHNNHKNVAGVLEKLDGAFPVWKDAFAELQKCVNGENYYKFIGLWKNQIQQIVFISAFYRYLDSETLISIPEVEKLLGLPGKKPDDPCAWAVELEDYLLGVSFLPAELSRLCVVAVIAEDYTVPEKISKFVSDLFAGFRLLNLKNDFLRKRFDSIKYDVKKIEEILYDIKIRQLGSKNPAPSQ